MIKTKQDRILNTFDAMFPDARCVLNHSNNLELLVAVMLSAQTTDEAVNKLTTHLFKKYQTVEDYANASLPELESDLHSIGLYRNKAKNIKAMAETLQTRFNGVVPASHKELITLPGVGRKTANVIQSVVFNKAAMAVDTHVFRVSHRIGLVPDSCTTPFSVEKELVKNIPEKLIPIAHHWLILHGRYVCQARTPKCDTCGLQMMCKYFCNTYKVTKEEPKAKNK